MAIIIILGSEIDYTEVYFMFFRNNIVLIQLFAFTSNPKDSLVHLYSSG
jgi:hypothetical protein